MKDLEWTLLREAMLCTLAAAKKLVWFYEDLQFSEEYSAYWLDRAEVWMALCEKNLQALRSL